MTNLIGNNIHNFARKLWGINRSLTGEGVRQTLEHIKELLPITKKNIFFSATWFFSNNSFLKKIIVKQLNYLPKEFYLYFFNLNSFIKIFKEQNFKVEFNKENETHPCSFENFKKLKIDNVKYTNILFTKN